MGRSRVDPRKPAGIIEHPECLTHQPILVGTPTYNGMVHADYVHSLLSYNVAGIRYSFLSIGGESLITRARKNIATKSGGLDNLQAL